FAKRQPPCPADLCRWRPDVAAPRRSAGHSPRYHSSTLASRCRRPAQLSGGCALKLASVRQQKHRRFNQPFKFLHESCRVVPVDDTVVATDRQVHHLTLADTLAAKIVAHEHGPLDN